MSSNGAFTVALLAFITAAAAGSFVLLGVKPLEAIPLAVFVVLVCAGIALLLTRLHR